MGFMSGMAMNMSFSTDEEIKKINKRLAKVEQQLKAVREIVYCPDCIYRKTCINTSHGIERDGFCKCGVREREEGDGDG